MGIMEIVVGLFLSICGYSDLKRREISLLIVGAFFVFGVIVQVIWVPLSPLEWIGGMAVGGGIFIAGAVTREAIGYGDAWVIGVLGLFLGVFTVIELLLIALTLSALMSAALLLCRKIGRKTRLPFVPFLFVAYIIWIAMEMKEVM